VRIEPIDPPLARTNPAQHFLRQREERHKKAAVFSDGFSSQREQGRECGVE